MGNKPGSGPFGPMTQGLPEYGGVRGNRIATAAMVCGIIGIVLAWVPLIFVAGTVLGILALIFGVKGLGKSKTTGKGHGFAMAGIATGIAALLLSIVGVILSVAVFRVIDDFTNPGPFDLQAVECRPTELGSTATGVLINTSASERDYTVFVKVTTPSDRSGGGRTSVVELDGVPAGGEAPWAAEVASAIGEQSCSVEVDVQGPFPFGLEVDPIDG